MKLELSILDIDLLLSALDSKEREILDRYITKNIYIPEFEKDTISKIHSLRSRLRDIIYSPKEQP